MDSLAFAQTFVGDLIVEPSVRKRTCWCAWEAPAKPPTSAFGFGATLRLRTHPVSPLCAEHISGEKSQPLLHSYLASLAARMPLGVSICARYAFVSICARYAFVSVCGARRPCGSVAPNCHVRRWSQTKNCRTRVKRSTPQRIAMQNRLSAAAHDRQQGWLQTPVHLLRRTRLSGETMHPATEYLGFDGMAETLQQIARRYSHWIETLIPRGLGHTRPVITTWNAPLRARLPAKCATSVVPNLPHNRTFLRQDDSGA
jgi:hypothetical protein